MKLTRARVENFRCIEDSQEFGIDDDLTCLVGKNESGKTTLLTALYRLNPIFSDGAKFERQKDYPRRFNADFDERHPSGGAPVVSTWWRLEDGEKLAVAGVFGNQGLTSDIIKVVRGYEMFTCSIPQNETAIVEHLLSTSQLHEEERAAVGAQETVVALRERVSALQEAARRDEFLQRIDSEFPEGSVSSAFWKVVPLPKFMLFSQYQRLQGQVSLEQIQKRQSGGNLESDDQVFLALCEMAGTTIDKVVSIQQFEELVSRFEGASNKISAEIFRYWTQNRFLKVQFRLDPAQPGDPAPFNTGKVFRTRIQNQLHEVSVPFDDRSTGFVWFFSFLALFSQVKKRHSGELILLLDEPGLSLHGKAQSDLLRYFKERLIPEHQVIFTTHSPFMVPPDNLLCARTVEDVVIHREGQPPEVHGTKVGGDVLSTDKDTLFPLQAALGYEITQSLFVGEHTLLVEGPSDLLYLKAMSDELRSRGRTGIDPRWAICPTGGVDKVGAFMSLFGGNRLHVAVLTDFAAGQKKKVDDLRRSALLKQGHVLTADVYVGQPEADIEDLLGAEFYAHLVQSCYGLKPTQAVPPMVSPGRTVKHVEDHFRTLPPDVAEFDHFSPSTHLMEKRAQVFKKAPGVELALDRFEKLFQDLNGFL